MGLAPSRARAQEMIAAGHVTVDGRILTKASRKVSKNADIAVSGDVHPWVSRGGVKLAHALAHFNVDVAGRACLDLGASTGGFCDVLLNHGAAKIYAVDVGHGQLHDKIKNDPRVINLEGTHAKDLSSALIPENVGVIVADVSFISLTKTLPHALVFADAGAVLIALIKPQFEAGPEYVGKGGIVRDDAVRQKCCADLAAFVNAQNGWQVRDITPSPIAGGDGNEEYLLYALKTGV